VRSGSLLLGLDVGSSTTKAVLVGPEGRERAVSAVPTPFRTRGSTTEATVDDLRRAVAAAVGGLGRAAADAAAVGVAGIAESGAPFDRAGHPLAPVIAWHDPRGAGVARRLEHEFGPGLAARLGRPLRSVSSVAKLGWLVESGVTGVSAWLGVPELCLFLLTGARATDHSLAACTGCWDLGVRTWIPELAEAAGFGVEVLPPVVGAGRPMGEVSAAGAAWSGLGPGIPVTVAGHDHLVGVAGSGAAAGDLVDSIGTAETVLAAAAALPDIGAALDRRVVVTVAPGGDGWALLASAGRAGLALACASAALGRDPSELDALATRDPEVLVAPGLEESLRRREEPRLPGGPPGPVWATLHDALAALTSDAADRVSPLLAARPTALLAIGGGARSGPAMAARARRVALPVRRSTVAEPVARGAALLAGVAAGWWPSMAAVPVPRSQARR
jgi:xylulokinase